MIHRLLVLALLCSVGYGFDEPRPQAPVLPVENLARFAPTVDYVARGNFLASYDGSRRVPRWTLERLTRESLIGDADRDDLVFYRDSATPDEFAADPRDYSGSLFDRGHLAAAANHQVSEAALKATFSLVNVMPQNPNLNRRVWASLEEHIRVLTNQPGVRCCWVVTAPAWLTDELQFVNGAYISFAHIRTIGKHKVWVPTHCAKAVLVEREDGSHQMYAWLMRNGETVDARLEKHVVTTNAIERACGLNLWADLPDELEEQLELGSN